MLVAVYGTLKRGYGNNRLLSSSEYVTTDTVRDFDLFFSGSQGSFPVAIPGDGSVVVEVWNIGDDESVLRNLDSLEGVPYMYQRLPVVTEDGLSCQMYVGPLEFWDDLKYLVPLNTDGQHEWKRAY